MLGVMIRPVVPFLLAALLAQLPAQQTLAELQRQFVEAAQRLDTQRASREQREQLLAQQAVTLQKFVADVAKGDDRWNGRLMLADLQMRLGNRENAGDALRGITTDEAPAMVLVTAATMAQRLNLRAQRDAWITAALAKDAPLADRLAMGRLLMTVLHEIERGDKVFEKALAAAPDDEQRAFVRWHRADALRDREDLPDNAAFDELDKLAKDLPGTYWGSVAKDRLRATQLKVGDDAIAFQAKTRAGTPWALAEQQGKVVVLAFWTAGDRDTPNLVGILQEQLRRHGDQLVVLGICLDRDDAAIGAAVQQLGIEFPVVGDGKGVLTDAALRWFVEGPVVHVVDRRGKVAALGQHAGTADARAELQAAIAGAMQRN